MTEKAPLNADAPIVTCPGCLIPMVLVRVDPGVAPFKRAIYRCPSCSTETLRRIVLPSKARLTNSRSA
jgi:hypothetical protein